MLNLREPATWVLVIPNLDSQIKYRNRLEAFVVDKRSRDAILKISF